MITAETTAGSRVRVAAVPGSLRDLRREIAGIRELAAAMRPSSWAAAGTC
jgi:hypothetical protein